VTSTLHGGADALYSLPAASITVLRGRIEGSQTAASK
jgi:hypothetical protein